MLYQKMLTGSRPYFMSVSGAAAFEVHRHPEIEISYCIEGEYDIVCDHKRYTLKSGDFAVVPPMMAHEILKTADCKKLTVEVGSVMLGEHFDLFARHSDNCIVYSRCDFENTQLAALFNETSKLYYDDAVYGELFVKSNIYKICAVILQMLSVHKTDTAQTKKLTDIKKIDMALKKIYDNYYEPLTVESVSAFCGYSKSNFCKIFKTVTGNTFHNTLNRHRVDVACMLLRDSDNTIEEIARDTGFYDTKSFCRVFKSVIGKTAGEYRKTQ